MRLQVTIVASRQHRNYKLPVCRNNDSSVEKQLDAAPTTSGYSIKYIYLHIDNTNNMTHRTVLVYYETVTKPNEAEA